MPVYEVREWVPRWVREVCLVEANSEEEAREAYDDGDILDYVPERDQIGDKVEGLDSYGIEISLEVPH